MTDYWLSKLFFDLTKTPTLAAEYRTDMNAVLSRYPLSAEARRAVAEDDVAFISPRVNAYLLRFYFQMRGMPEPEFIARLHAMKSKETANG